MIGARPASVVYCLLWAIASAASEPDGPGVREDAARRAALRGDLHTAAVDYAEAARLYTDARDPEGRIRALVRLGELERDLGRHQLAIRTLTNAVAVAQTESRLDFEVAARGALAGALLVAGDRDAALREAREANALGSRLDDPRLRAAVAQELANVLASSGDSRAALQEYDRAARIGSEAGDPGLVFRVRVNAAAAAAAVPELDPARLVAVARASGGSLEESRANAYAWIRLGRSARRIGDPLARSDFERALAIARSLDDPGAVSWSVGSTAALLADQGRSEEALPLARDALREARRARLPDAELQWLSLAGRIQRDLGQRDSAIRDLLAATDLLAERRASTTATDRTQEAANEISDVYVDLVDLLLSRAHQRGDREAASVDLRAAQRALERFKAGELRDYFRDDCVDAYREKVRDAASASPTAAVVYPVSLRDRLEILVSRGKEIRAFRAAAPAREIEAEIKEFRRQLTIRTSRRFLTPARRLHEWIVAPIQAYLDQMNVDTLVFVPGGQLRTVPLAALHDGERFLIERYAVATTPGLELTDPRSLDRSVLSVFLGGLSEAVQGFPALPHVGGELGNIKEILGSGEVLLDERFTSPAVKHSLEANPFSVVHIATHGEFGNTADDFYLLTHDGRLTLDELAASVGAFRFRERPLELIVLSACDTAADNPKAALGLAGVAVKSGARSAIGSLWKVNDEATALLIDGFYRALREPGVSRAEALRRAQRNLISDRRFDHPAYWSPFLLISNWL